MLHAKCETSLVQKCLAKSNAFHGMICSWCVAQSCPLDAGFEDHRGGCDPSPSNWPSFNGAAPVAFPLSSLFGGQVESDAVSEVLARLAAISSREKAARSAWVQPPLSLRANQALELVHRSPSLLAAAMGGKAGGSLIM